MNRPENAQFERLKADLHRHESIARRTTPDRQFLGVGRTVLLGSQPIGVYARSASTVIVDFIKNGRVIAYANYRVASHGNLTVGHNEHPESSLSIDAMAKNLGGIALYRHPLNHSEQAVSEAELQFITGFVRDPANTTAMVKYADEPNQPLAGLDVLQLLSNLTTPL